MATISKPRKRKAISAETPVAPEAVAPISAPQDVVGAPPKVTLDVSAAPSLDSPSVEMKKKELVDLVVARSGVKKRDAKPAIEAALAILGQALAESRPLNLKPLGKAKVSNVKDKDNATVINMRLRQPKNSEIS